MIGKIVKEIVEAVKGKTTAVYGGGFKPPTKGHFEVVDKALKQNPSIDEFIIYVGDKERDGVTQTQATLIWEVFKRSLPMKVKIVPTSKPPVQAIYNYAKENSQEEVLWVIGARQDNEDDFADISNRTKSMSKYPNMELRTIITTEGVSGTAARNALKVSKDKFRKFLPKELTDGEVQEVFDIVSVTESLNEHASYTDSIDVVEKISELTNYMIDKGMNIQPLPTLEFVDGDSNNAKDFFGKTAYYDPQERHIVLYTEGRHPKDIVRSFAHEMIHHIQNLEGRLGDINTTNTQEDGNLNNLEKEANLKGTMTFRNWTDSLNENLNEGKYDGLVTKLSGFTLNAWKSDFEDKQKLGKFELEIGPGREFDYPHLSFDYSAEARFMLNTSYKTAGYAQPNATKVKLNFIIPSNELPKLWSKIAIDLRNTIRHEIEHLMQSGPNVKKGKEMDSDQEDRDELTSGKKPWWKIWRKTLDSSEYYKLEKEIDANLQGLYLQAKKSKQPLDQVVDDYLALTLNLPQKEREGIKKLWAKRAPKLNIPYTLNEKKKKDYFGLNAYAAELARLREEKKKNPNPKKGTGKKPKGSGRRLYTDEDPKDTIGIKFSTRQDIVDTFNKKSFKNRSHQRQSQVINLVHQRVRAAYNRAKDPAVKKRLKTALDYAEERKEASKKKTQRLKNQKENIDPKSQSKHKGKAAPYGSAYKKVNEIGVNLSNYKGQVLPGDVVRAPKDFPLGGKKLEKSLELKVLKNSREGVNRYKLSLEDPKTGKKYTVRNFQMDGEYKGKKLPKWGMVRRSKENMNEGDTIEKYSAKGKATGKLKQGTVRKRLNIPKGKKIPLSLINKELARLRKMDKDPDKKGAQLGDKNQKYYKALQLAKTLKTTTNVNEEYKIYLDLDGVVADFDRRFKDLSGMEPNVFESKHGKNAFWEFVDRKHKVAFWVGIPPMPQAKELVEYVSKHNYEVLTAPSVNKQSVLGKSLWVRNHVGEIFPSKPKVNFKFAKEKHKVKPNLTEYDILIDDKSSTIDRWNSAGGTGILFTSTPQTIGELKKLGI